MLFELGPKLGEKYDILFLLIFIALATVFIRITSNSMRNFLHHLVVNVRRVYTTFKVHFNDTLSLNRLENSFLEILGTYLFIDFNMQKNNILFTLVCKHFLIIVIINVNIFKSTLRFLFVMGFLIFF